MLQSAWGPGLLPDLYSVARLHACFAIVFHPGDRCVDHCTADTARNRRPCRWPERVDDLRSQKMLPGMLHSLSAAR